ncbi:MAG: phosphocholine cytidylyltransferase family protein [Desulfobaccales bacterium]
MKTITTAVISAAGFGTRLGWNLPKCLVTIAGRRIIEYQLELLGDFPEVRMVVGFKKDEVISYVARLRPDIIFVHNHHYATTSPLQSFWLGAHDLRKPFLLLDGDVIIEPQSFSSFLQQFSFPEALIGVTPANTQNAVFVRLMTAKDGTLKIQGFQRQPGPAYEWTGVAVIPEGEMLVYENKYVYQCLEDYLPLRAGILNCLEIDTPRDYERAEKILARHWGLGWPEEELAAVAPCP